MVRRLAEWHKAVIFVAILSVTVAGLYAYVQANQAPRVQPEGVRGVHLTIDGGDWKIDYGPAETTNNSAFAILMEASKAFGFPVEYIRYTIPDGVFVTAINGSVNGDGGRFWQYWVSGNYGSVAADHAAVHDGDTILWLYTSPREGTQG